MGDRARLRSVEKGAVAALRLFRRPSTYSKVRQALSVQLRTVPEAAAQAGQ